MSVQSSYSQQEDKSSETQETARRIPPIVQTPTPPQQAHTQAKSPEKPEKKGKKSSAAFRTISEVAKELDVQQHVLRFWETKFSHVKPLKRGGGRRYYRPEDVELLKTIHSLLYTEGYTIKGVQKLLREQGRKQVVRNNNPDIQAKTDAQVQQSGPSQGSAPRQYSSIVNDGLLGDKYRTALEAMLSELKEIRDMIDD